MFITLVLTTTLLIVLLPGVTAPTITCYVSFVFRSVLGVYFLMLTSLRRLFPYSQNLSGSQCLILLNTEQSFFFSIFSLIRVLPNASKMDFNSSPFHVNLWAILQEPLFMTLRCDTHIATLGNAHWPTVPLNISMI